MTLFQFFLQPLRKYMALEEKSTFALCVPAPLSLEQRLGIAGNLVWSEAGDLAPGCPEASNVELFVEPV